MILITGSNGLIGSFIIKKLIEEKIAFKALIRKNADLTLLDNISEKIDFVEGDILDVLSLESAFDGIDKVIHCAAIVSFGEGGVEQMYEVNVEGTKNVVNCALKYKIDRFIYLSSVAAIGRNTTFLEITENTQWVESGVNSEYSKSKYLAEIEVWRAMEEGLCGAMVNPSVVLGPGDWNKSSTKIFKNVYKGLKFYPQGYVNVVDVRDVASAVVLLLKSNIKAERFILNGHYLSYKDFLGKVATSLGKKAPSIGLSKKATLIAYYLLKLLIPFYFKKRFINSETIKISNSRFNYSNNKFKDAFDFEYRNLDETIKWVCDGLLKTIIDVR